MGACLVLYPTSKISSYILEYSLIIHVSLLLCVYVLNMYCEVGAEFFHHLGFLG